VGVRHLPPAGRGGLSRQGAKDVGMDMKLEVVPIPVSDVDAAKTFYT
jgi:hypothetical protein